MKKEILRIEGVTIEQGSVTYLNDFHLWLAEGEILGLTATNQHGLDHLIELITDNTPIKYGQVYFAGELVNDYIHSGKGKNRVSVIDHQSRLVPGLTVADNIFVLRRGFKKYIIEDRILEKQVQQTFSELGFPIQANALVESLTVFERCVIELVKAVMGGIKLFIVRDIATMISYSDLQRFYQLLIHYQKQGAAFLYIGSHHEEVFEIATRFVLYDRGRIHKVFYPEEMSDQYIHPFVEQISREAVSNPPSGEPVLRLAHIMAPRLNDFSCDIYSGECLTILDKDHAILDDFIGALLKAGEKKSIMIIPEDPVHKFLFWDQSYLYNLCFQVDQKMGRILIPRKIRKSIRKEWQQEIGAYIDAPDLYELPTDALYDLVYYRIRLYHPRIVLLLQPFSGADMYLRLKIAEWITKLKESQIAVVLLSSYVADTLAVTDRLILVENGRSVSTEEMLDRQFINKNYYKDRYIEYSGSEIK